MEMSNLGSRHLGFFKGLRFSGTSGMNKQGLLAPTVFRTATGTGNEVRLFFACASVTLGFLPLQRPSLVRQTEQFDVLATTGVLGEYFINLLIDFQCFHLKNNFLFLFFVNLELLGYFCFIFGFFTHYGMRLQIRVARKIAGPITICALTKGADACLVL